MAVDLTVSVQHGIRLNEDELNAAAEALDSESDAYEFLYYLKNNGVDVSGIGASAGGTYYFGDNIQQFIYNRRTRLYDLTSQEEGGVFSLDALGDITLEEAQALDRVAREMGQTAPVVETFVSVLWS